MYAKYTTDAVVLGTRDRGESDKTAILFTRDFGLVYARAGGARHERSLMRYSLVVGGAARTSLVKGKAGWRLAGAVPQGFPPHGAALMAFARIACLLTRLVQGEEENAHLFETLSLLRQKFAEATDEHVVTLELLGVTRVLYTLGYLSPEASGGELVTQSEITSEHLLDTKGKRKTLLAAVNAALSASQL